MDVFLAVDGGGTKTKLALYDASGRLQGELETGPSAWFDMGVDETARVLLESTEALLVQSAASRGRLRAAAFCLACVGENPEGDAALARRLGALCAHTLIANDSLAALYAAHAGGPGIVVASGTGSIACGMGEDGALARCGGYSPTFSDEGSACWIACRAMELFCKQDDGRLPRGPLHDEFSKELGVDSAYALMAWEERSRPLGRKAIAALQPLAARAAQLGDVGAAALYARAAEELALLALGVRRKLRFAASPVPIACVGGTFLAGALLTEPLAHLLTTEGMALVSPRLDAPVKGAAVLSLKTGNIPITEEILINLCE